MKKTFSFLALLMVVAWFGCNQVANETGNELTEELQPTEDASLPAGVIPKDIDLNEFINFSDRYTWKDLDDYYLNTLPKYFGKSYYNNLKKATLIHLVDVFDMPKYAEKEKLEYYVNEMKSLDWFPPEPFVEAVSALEQHGWTNDQLKQLAIERYNKNQDFISKTLADGSEQLSKLNKEMEKLKAFTEQL